MDKNHCAKVVTEQLDAYNKRDLEMFCRFFSPDVEAWQIGRTEPIAVGLAAFRKVYEARFRGNPLLHAKVEHRTVLPPYVTDCETITGWGKDPITAVAIYRIQGNRIDRVWFVRETE